MVDLDELWKAALPEIKNGVTGVGVWTALNQCQPLSIDDGVAVIGMPQNLTELTGHLKMPQTKRLIEQVLGKRLGKTITLRVIDGTTQDDLDRMRRKDAEARKLQDQQLDKMRAEMGAKSSWEGIYEQLSRRYAAVPNRSLPQNRARFLEEAIEIIAETRQSQATWDDLGERNFARCIERVSQYCEVPSAVVAALILKRAGEL